jgi:hypothetical protein
MSCKLSCFKEGNWFSVLAKKKKTMLCEVRVTGIELCEVTKEFFGLLGCDCVG